ncbi:MAG: peptidoglycan editing factor PgeF [Mariprofundales bacterium]
MLTSPLLASIGIQAAFSEAVDGAVRDENDIEGANRLCHRGSFPPPAHQCRQLHGNKIWHVENNRATDGADILLCATPTTTLAVRSADCLPILLADAEAGVIAAVHAGWRGTAATVAGEAVAAMTALGAKPERIHASMGPAIGSCCFTIEEPCRQQLARCADGVGITPWDGAWRADLAQINAHHLQCAGIQKGQIEQRGSCTCCQPQRFFSHRRNSTNLRQLALISR